MLSLCSGNPICSRPRTPSVGLPRLLANAAHAGGDVLQGAAMNLEIWKTIDKFEGYYEVSDLGNVRSVTRTVPDKKLGSRVYKGKILKWNTNSCGYRYVVLTKLGKGLCKAIHKLVADAFLPNPGHLKEVDHKSGVKSDNSLINLERVSTFENRRRAWDIGLYGRADKSPSSKLTTEMVKEIRRLFSSGEITNQADIARRFNISAPVINTIIKGKAWKNA